MIKTMMKNMKMKTKFLIDDAHDNNIQQSSRSMLNFSKADGAPKSITFKTFDFEAPKLHGERSKDRVAR